MSDLKTLRLASAQLSAESLEAFLVYERTLIAALATAVDPAQTSWAGRFAFAHGKALMASGLDAMMQQRLKVLVGEFCGKSSALTTVRERLSAAQAAVDAAAAAGAPPPAKDASVVARAPAELRRLGDFSGFSERYGPAALELLKAREAEVLTLHRQLSRLEGAGGHLHPA